MIGPPPKVVTFVNDHDQVSRGEHKARFCADPETAALVLNALALNVTTLGTPCIHYGTEQRFDRRRSRPGADRYIREAMLGGRLRSIVAWSRILSETVSRSS